MRTNKHLKDWTSRTMQLVEPMAQPAPRRKAFTLLELLVVIAIIAVLATLLIMGVRSVVRSAREKTTRTQMENLKSMIAERQNSGGMTAIYNLYLVIPVTTANPYGLPLPQNSLANTPINVPLSVVDDSTSDRYPAFATLIPSPDPKNEVARTMQVMTLLRSVPANAKMLAQLPTDTFLTGMPPSVVIPTNSPPIPIDGWGNPMIYAPPAGITVYTTGASGIATATVITSPDHKGFWVSAGPDGFIGGYLNNAIPPPPAGKGPQAQITGTPVAGDTAYGDDNVYSFEN